MKVCRSCRTPKPDEGFYNLRSNYSHKTWLSNDCRKCKNVMDHQRVLAKDLELGKPVINCNSCGILMRKMATRKVCLQCIGESDGK